VGSAGGVVQAADIVSDDALYRALKEGWIAGAGVDDPARRVTTPKRRSAPSARSPGS
jgi:lactate dehydrogenase-like 2-hydroxyacid dehydrogenase